MDIWPSNPMGPEDQSDSWPGAWLVSAGDAASGASRQLPVSHSCSLESQSSPQRESGEQGTLGTLRKGWRIEKGCHSPVLGPAVDSGAWQWGRGGCGQNSCPIIFPLPLTTSCTVLPTVSLNSPKAHPFTVWKERGAAAAEREGPERKAPQTGEKVPGLDLFPGAIQRAGSVQG